MSGSDAEAPVGETLLFTGRAASVESGLVVLRYFCVDEDGQREACALCSDAPVGRGAKEQAVGASMSSAEEPRLQARGPVRA